MCGKKSRNNREAGETVASLLWNDTLQIFFLMRTGWNRQSLIDILSILRPCLTTITFLLYTLCYFIITFELLHLLRR